MIRILLPVVATALLLPTTCSGAPPLPVEGCRLVWSDEFDGPSLDTSKWEYRTDDRMWSRQMPANVSLRDGHLLLAVRKEQAGKMNYTGAGIISRNGFLHGYYEARLKVPPGAGWHTSFWMMRHDGKGGTGPSKTSQELDVCENDSVNPLGYGVNVHRWNPQPHRTFGHRNIPSPDLSKEFHVFGCEFTTEHITFFLDGRPVQTVPATEFPHGEQNIWLTSIASPLGGTKTVDDTRVPATAEFDYVRYYEKIPAPKKPGDTTPPPMRTTPFPVTAAMLTALHAADPVNPKSSTLCNSDDVKPSDGKPVEAP
jgi:beta-glucanase (GH16 family)